MTLENLKKANGLAGKLDKINKVIVEVKNVHTDAGMTFVIGDPFQRVYIMDDMLDPMAKEGCKALILSNLEGKKRQLEAELEKL
jgi:hypothetical protein